MAILHWRNPPLWILPAWPIANLAINRIVRFLRITLPKHPRKMWVVLYWIIFPIFLALMVPFVWPTMDQPLTILATLACCLITISPTSHRTAVLTFIAGIGLGYFLELWGTTRECWAYYTEATTPLFTILAHGMAAVSVWRVIVLMQRLLLCDEPGGNKQGPSLLGRRRGVACDRDDEAIYK